MLRNKMIVRKLRNIFILIMVLAIMIGAYKKIGDSRAENVIEIETIALDNYGYLANELFKLEGVKLDGDTYEVEIPESINGKKINEIIKITLEDPTTEVESESAVQENASAPEEGTTEEETTPPAEDTTTEEEGTTPPVEDATTEEEEATPPAEDTTTEEEETTPPDEDTTTEEEETTPPAEDTTTEEEETTPPDEDTTTEEEETTPPAEDTTTEEQVPAEPEVIEIIDNKIYLSKEQIDNKQLKFEVVYDVAIVEKNEQGEFNKNILTEKTEEERKQIEITEETEIVYSKILKYEDEEYGKIVEVRGYLPKDAELKVEPVSQAQLEEIFGDKKIDVAYDIKILIHVEKEVLVDEADPSKGTTTIVETIEVNPEDFGESCEVSIKDVEIKQDSQVYHVKEDNTYEQVTVTENTEENITFEAETFSIYAVSSDEGIMTTAISSDWEVSITPSSSTTWQTEQTVTINGFCDELGLKLLTYTWSKSKNEPDFSWDTWGSASARPSSDNLTIQGYPLEFEVSSNPFASSGMYYLHLRASDNWLGVGGDEETSYRGYAGPYAIDYEVDNPGTITLKYGSASGTTFTTGSTSANATWTNQNVYLSMNEGSDNCSGLDQTAYDVELNGEIIYNDITNPITVSSEGTYKVKVWSWDVLWNYGEREYVFVIDKTKPTLTLTSDYWPDRYVNKDYERNNGGSGDPYMRLTATDNSGYIGKLYWWQDENEKYMGDDENGNPIYGEFCDPDNPLEEENDLSSAWDNDIYGSNAVGYTSSPATATPGFSDDYNLDIFYKVYDRAGNVSETASMRVLIDSTAPNASVAMNLGDSTGDEYENDTWTNQDVYIALNSEDLDGGLGLGEAISGILEGSESYTVTKDGSVYNGLENQTAATTLTEEGTYTITITATDNAGNTGTGTKTVKIDKTAPTITLGSNSNTTWSKTASVTVTVADDLSGLAASQKVKYGWSESTSTAPTYTEETLTNASGAASTTFTASASGLTGKYYLWVVQVSDEAGNVVSTAVKSTGTFYMDNTSPVISPDIVRDGLIRCYDGDLNAGSDREHVAGIEEWVDLSVSEQNGTLMGNAYFTGDYPDNDGYLLLEGDGSAKTGVSLGTVPASKVRTYEMTIMLERLGYNTTLICSGVSSGIGLSINSAR